MRPSAADFARLVDRDRLIDRLQRLVRTPSENPPGNEAEVAALTATFCEELGLEPSLHEVEPKRPSVVARWRGDGHKKLCYCSHIDVVPVGDPTLWERDPFSGHVSDGLMHGRGSSDAKGPVAAALEAVEILKASGFQPAGILELAFVADEETMGLRGAGPLVEQGIIGGDYAIVGEPTSLRVVRAQRGPCWLRITTHGVAGHGSAPERGVNAVKHMAEIILHLEETLPDISHPVLGGPSISVGTIHGGEKVNVIPAGCVIEVDRRSIPGETRESVIASVEAAIELARERFPDIDARVDLPFLGQPFETRQDSPVVQSAAGSISEVLEREAEIIGFIGSSDARFLAEAGADTILYGPGDIATAHTARESIDLSELERGAVAYALNFARLLS